jgi:hypothetical protein
VVHIRSLDPNGSPLPSDSFDIQTETDEDRKKIRADFQRLIDRTTRRPKGAHAQHNFRIFILSNEDSDYFRPKPPPVCEICKIILIGQLFSGYECVTCNKLFHEKCFLTGKPDPTLVEGLGQILMIIFIFL